MTETLDGRRIFITTDAMGGVWTYTLDLARELGAAGMECTLAVMGPAPEQSVLTHARGLPRAKVVLTGLPLDWLAASGGDILSAGRDLAALASEQRCDLVQLHAPALAAAEGFDRPVVSVHHSCLATWWQAVRPGRDMPEAFRWHVTLTARGLAGSDMVVTPTTAVAHAVARAYGLASPPVTIRNGRHMPPDEDWTDAAAREAFVLTSGRLWDDGKNAITLDRAAARLGVPVVAAGPVAGPSGEGPGFRHLRLLGQVSQGEIRHWLAGAPIYASAARYEPFGLGVLEAAQAGCALVLSDIPSFRELWSGACLFVAPDDDAGFASAVACLLGDPGLLRRLAGRARSRARHYSAAGMARDMMRLYAGLLTLERVGRGAAA